MASKKFVYDYPRAAVTTDVVLLRSPRRPEVLLIRRDNGPFAGSWALPGGFIEMDEGLEDSARRELEEETGLRAGRLVQLGTWGEPGRDPRGRTVTVVYVGWVSPVRSEPRAGDDAAAAEWFPLERAARGVPGLAFDHVSVLRAARRWIRPRPKPSSSGSRKRRGSSRG